MTRQRRLGTGFLALLLSLLALAGRGHLPFAQAAQTWDVQVGDNPADGGSTVNAFLPSVLTVPVGDTVRWTYATQLVPHSVTFLSGAGRLPDFVPGPNPGELLGGPGGAPRGVQAAGTSYDGSGIINTGNLAAPDNSPFLLTFTAPGVYGYACMFHTGMNGTISVLPASATPPETPAQAQARGKSEDAGLVAQLRATVAHAQAGVAAAAGLPGVTSIAAGLSTATGGSAGGASALQFLPGTVSVRRGDAVAWTVADPLEIHTITFTSGAPPPPFVDFVPLPGGPPGVLIPFVPVERALAVGGSSYTGSGFVHSGVLEPGSGYVLYIDAPAGTYQYTCIVHPGMNGSITVTE